MTPADLIKHYIELRNKLSEIKAQHEEEQAQYKDVMAQIENRLLAHLDQAKLESFKSTHGTAYKQLNTSVSVEDWDAALQYVRDNERWELLEKRIAKNAAVTVIEETEKPIPGTKISQTIVLRVRTT